MRVVIAVLAVFLMLASPVAAASLHIGMPEAAKQAGPQKIIPNRVEITNLESQSLDVAFRVVSHPGGRWFVIVPDPITISPGDTQTVIVEISTPYKTGYVEGRGRFLLEAIPVSSSTEQPVGEPAQFELAANVKGWYVPGPSPLLLVGALVGAAFMARRLRSD